MNNNSPKYCMQCGNELQNGVCSNVTNHNIATQNTNSSVAQVPYTLSSPNISSTSYFQKKPIEKLRKMFEQ